MRIKRKYRKIELKDKRNRKVNILKSAYRMSIIENRGEEMIALKDELCKGCGRVKEDCSCEEARKHKIDDIKEEIKREQTPEQLKFEQMIQKYLKGGCNEKEKDYLIDILLKSFNRILHEQKMLYIPEVKP